MKEEKLTIKPLKIDSATKQTQATFLGDLTRGNSTNDKWMNANQNCALSNGEHRWLPFCSSSHCAVSWFLRRLLCFIHTILPLWSLSMFAHFTLGFCPCSLHFGSRLTSFVIRPCFVLFGVCFCEARPPLSFYCPSPVVSLPALYSPPFLALSEHHLPICRFLVPGFAPPSQPADV